MTDKNRLAEIESRAEAAPKGPWRVALSRDAVYAGTEPVADIFFCAPMVATAEFIAHTREDVPWLVERLKAVHEVLDHLRLVSDDLNEDPLDCDANAAAYWHGQLEDALEEGTP